MRRFTGRIDMTMTSLHGSLLHCARTCQRSVVEGHRLECGTLADFKDALNKRRLAVFRKSILLVRILMGSQLQAGARSPFTGHQQLQKSRIELALWTSFGAIADGCSPR